MFIDRNQLLESHYSRLPATHPDKTDVIIISCSIRIIPSETLATGHVATIQCLHIGATEITAKMLVNFYFSCWYIAKRIYSDTRIYRGRYIFALLPTLLTHLTSDNVSIVFFNLSYCFKHCILDCILLYYCILYCYRLAYSINAYMYIVVRSDEICS